jgi:hypothetical protein
MLDSLVLGAGLVTAAIVPSFVNEMRTRRTVFAAACLAKVSDER